MDPDGWVADQAGTVAHGSRGSTVLPVACHPSQAPVLWFHRMQL